MYKKDLALNNLKWLICHKPNQIKPSTDADCTDDPAHLAKATAHAESLTHS